MSDQRMDIDVSFLDKLDSLIKQGQGEEVRKLLESIRPVDVPRAHRAPLAKISLRIGESQFAFQLLRPLAQSETPLIPTVTADEWIQYGMCLKQMGASDPALKIFQQVDSEKHPEVLLYEAITLFTQWRYSDAIPKLQSYLQSSLVGEYQKRIGSLNLASALIYESRLQEAQNLLVPLAEKAKEENHHLLHGNALELMAQVALYQQNFEAAKSYLEQGSQLIQQSAPIYRLFIEKWTAVLQLFESNVQLFALQNLNAVRNRALELKHWESVRDCDFFFAVAKKDTHLFRRLYFGTPYESYRQRLLRQFPLKEPMPEYFDWRGNTAHHKPQGALQILDLRSGSSKGNLRLLKALSMDFYSPVKPFALYLTLFPEEKLDPTAALPKIFSAVSRAKKWLADENIPIEVATSEAGYRLHWTGPYALRVSDSLRPQRAAVTTFEDLQKHFSQQSFTTLDAAEKLGLPQRTVLRLLSDGVSEQWLEVTGKGRSTRYRIKAAKAS